jgi:hypothetical protein
MTDNKDWRVIPDFPLYELTFDGQVRTRSHHAEMTLHGIADEPDMVVSLWREGGMFKRDIRGLIYEVFPELRPVDPESRRKLIKSVAMEMEHWVGGEVFGYRDFENIVDVVIREGWRPSEQ